MNRRPVLTSHLCLKCTRLLLFHKNSEWRIGETVFHKKFGEGVIVGLEGQGTNVRANINFGRHGMKLLDLSIAKLEHAS